LTPETPRKTEATSVTVPVTVSVTERVTSETGTATETATGSGSGFCFVSQKSFVGKGQPHALVSAILANGMTLFEIVAVLISLAALFSYVNHRLLRLPTTIGLMLMALSLSLAVLALGLVFPSVEQGARDFLAGIDFNQALMHGMLGFLLFAGALHIDLGDLAQQKLIVAMLATVGVLLSTVVKDRQREGRQNSIRFDPGNHSECLAAASAVVPFGVQQSVAKGLGHTGAAIDRRAAADADDDLACSRLDRLLQQLARTEGGGLHRVQAIPLDQFHAAGR